MVSRAEYVYFGAVIGFIIIGLIKNTSLNWAAIGGIIGGAIGYIVWRLGRA